MELVGRGAIVGLASEGEGEGEGEGERGRKREIVLTESLEQSKDT